jgi:ABC-type Fe3+-hydroxamate transport system, periplasmic component
MGPTVLSLMTPAFAQKQSEAHRDKSTAALAKPSAPEKASSIRKIVSLAPSNTELIYSVGGENLLEGVSTYCEYPPAVKSKQKVGSFVSVNLEKLTLLKPDLVLLVSGQEALSIQLQKRKIPTKVLRNSSLNDIAVNLEEIGQICSRRQEAKVLKDKYLVSLGNLSELLADTKPARVFFCVWPGPVITVGGNSFLNDCITKCGGTNIAASLKGAYPRFGSERLVASRPEIVILPHEANGTGLLKKRRGICCKQ